MSEVYGQLPWWYSAVYGVSNVSLTILNIFWCVYEYPLNDKRLTFIIRFSKMLAKIGGRNDKTLKTM